MAICIIFGIIISFLYLILDKKAHLLKKPLTYLIISAIAALGVWIYIQADNVLVSIKSEVLILFLAICSADDIKERIVRNKIIAIFAITACVLNFTSMDLEVIIGNIVGAVIMLVVMLFCMFVSGKSIGMGDVKLISVMTFFSGLVNAVSIIFYALASIILWGIIMLILRKKEILNNIPMVPFIAISAVINCILV